ncbi:uncharacterized protein LOC114355995 [Ostrinia furnacalis]|uniref:uncharacterized protein LOC114355995 n=1 Tax=Ostrinia furnacalis TaxID=93504 RepID=UPI00103D03B8|nr:uncharacterized protein LOC114355995 [Ostrinia furnacalis]
MATTVPYNTMSTSEPLFKKCCFCFPLRTGCLILGYLNLAFNLLYTLGILGLIVTIGIATDNFEHFERFNRQPYDNLEPTPEVESVDPSLYQFVILLIVIVCSNVVWLAINIACLVVLHKKRPGPVRMFVGFATAHLLLTLAGFVFYVMNSNRQAIMNHSIDFVLTACFVLVYYVYATQLTRVQEEAPEESPSAPSDNIAYIIPPLVDKKTLVV